MKIVIDNNVYLSAFLTHGLSSRILDICIDRHEIYISQWIITEIKDKLITKFKIKQQDIIRIINFINSITIKTKPSGNLPDISRDKDDNNILQLAEHINAEIIITGDKDLLSLKKYKNTIIINPRNYMEIYYKK